MNCTRCITTALRIARLTAAIALFVRPLVAQEAWRTLPHDLWLAAYGASSGVQTLANSGGSLGQANVGRGMSFRLGWSGDSTLAVFLGLEQSTLTTNDALLAGPYSARDIEVGGRVSFPMTRQHHVVPFVEVSALSRQMTAPLSGAGQTASGGRSTLTANGWGGALDAGLSVFVVPGAALEASAGLAVGPLTDLRVNGSTYWQGSVTSVTTRLRVGLALWPAAWLNR
jgi:hypothetical protein